MNREKKWTGSWIKERNHRLIRREKTPIYVHQQRTNQSWYGWEKSITVWIDGRNQQDQFFELNELYRSIRSEIPK